MIKSILKRMEKTELQIILNFLADKQQYFSSELEEFEKSYRLHSVISSALDPEIKLDLSLFKEEVIHNLSFEEKSKIVNYYQKIVAEIKTKNFTNSVDIYKPDATVFSYYDEQAFLDEYNSNHPNDNDSEGEIEFNTLCFNGYLHSYKNILNEIIETIKTGIDTVKIEEFSSIDNNKKHVNIPPINEGLTDMDIKERISQYLGHLRGRNFHGERIMAESEWERLQHEIFKIIKHNKLPMQINEYEINGISIESITHTFSLLHKSVYLTSRKNDNFIKFLKSWFPQKFLNWEESTIKSNFNNKAPKRYPF